MTHDWMDRRGKHHPKVRVRLTCGCTVLLREAPFHKDAKLSCGSGMGHGYALGWVSWTDTRTQRSGENPVSV